MRSEDLDKKIKEAADQHHPAYDEKAWQKMEKLLNEHLPQPKNDRRRIMFFLLLALLIGGGTFMIVSKPWEKNPKTAYEPVQKNKNSNQPDQPKTSETSIESKTNVELNKETVKERGSDAGSNSEIDNSSSTDKNLIASSSRNISSNKPQLVKGQEKNNNNSSVLSSNNSQNDIAVSKESQNPTADNSREPVSKPNNEAADITKSNKSDANKDESTLTTEKTNQEIAKTETKGIAKAATQKRDGKPGNRNGFIFSISAGPDVSKAGTSKTGKTALVYGAGIGYTRNRFTLRTGVYATKKIYWADPSEYKLSYTPPPGTTFEGADANCDVINIPVKLSYNFGFGTKNNWFVGAGLSSYLMKRETYLYKYKTAWSSYDYKNEIKNVNKHYFSVLNLSGGYTRQLNNTFSISAEPYVEIPLTGIGAGKVHLNSGGLLFTLGVKPFKK